MRIASWNVNSLNARMPRVVEWLERMQPNVVCMQETKMKDEAFPKAEFEALGYQSAHHGSGRWNGVAILSNVGLEDVSVDFDDGEGPDIDTRVIWARCNGVKVGSVYVPNGREVDHDHYHYKLNWLKRLRAHLDATAKPDELVAVLGDYNIAPTDEDVWDTKAFEGKTHVTQAERDALKNVTDWGLVDTFCHLYPNETGLFSYYDYMAGRFHRRHGIRIDLILASHPLVQKATGALVDRNGRKVYDGHKPSDHVPIYADFDLGGVK